MMNRPGREATERPKTGHGSARAMRFSEQKKALAVFLVSMMLMTSFTLVNLSMDAAAEELPAEVVPVPWTSDFTPLDSAWDSSGDNCVVVGNDTSGVQPSAWHYNETNGWKPIYEGTDSSIPPVNLVENDVTEITYGTIQAAIDAAIAGDTLNVWSGTYNENIVINKKLTLKGNGSASTRIDGGNIGPTVTIAASGVKLNGFNVTGAIGHEGILLYEVGNCRIENNTVYGNSDGICVTGSSNNVIINNDIINNDMVGVRVEALDAHNTLIGTTYYGGAVNQGTLLEMDTSGSDRSIIHDFTDGNIDGRYPDLTQLVEDGTYLYGMTSLGGEFNRGIVFRTSKDGTTHDVLHDFKGGPSDGQYPKGGLTLDGSILYGMTDGGGPSGYGTIFKMNTDGSGFRIMHLFTDMPDGHNPWGKLTQVGNTLYGMTNSGGANNYGTIFKINTNGAGYSTLFNFNLTTGANPYGSLLHDSGVLFGMTYNGGTGGLGTVFRINIDGSMYSCLMSFNTTNGARPRGSLILDNIDLQTLYGMTVAGGSSNLGTIFKIRKDGTNPSLILSFNGTATGKNPQGSLHQDNLYLYGTTFEGGANNFGVVFCMRKGTSSFNLLYNFTLATGTRPKGTLIFDGTWLYGTTYGGGTFSSGAIFKIDTSGTQFFNIHMFNNQISNGRYPLGNVIMDPDGTTLYGVTEQGGNNGRGIAYKIQRDGTGFTILHHFIDATGSYPWGNLTLSGNKLYGTAYNDGTWDAGVVFSMNTDGNAYTVLHDFAGFPSVDNPHGNVLLVGSELYGTTRYGGKYGFGTIFRVPTTGGCTILHEFNNSNPTDGEFPWGGLIYDGTALYGMTSQGGLNSFGMIFRINTDGTGFHPMFHFSVANCGYPYGSLVMDGSMMYGITCNGGAYGYGGIFSIDKDTEEFTLMHSLTSEEGENSRGSLFQDDWKLYGMTASGGINNYGTVIAINKTTYELTVLHDFAGAPFDGGWPAEHNDFIMVQDPEILSEGNYIYHNNFINNAVQASNDDLWAQYWQNGYPSGGNYWSDYSGPDDFKGVDQDILGYDGIIDNGRTIAGIAGVSDWFPWARQDGWAMPYATFNSVVWDDVQNRFWICGEVSADASSEVYYIPEATPTTMVPIPTGEPITFTAMAMDTMGNILVGGDGLSCMYYYNPITNEAFDVTESISGSMLNWNITDITFNPNDSRFYIVGIVTDSNPEMGVAFFTDPVPLGVGSMCYLVPNTPSSDMRAIAWNSVKDCALAVGGGVYKLEAYDGDPGYNLIWETIQAPEVGKYYYDISWDAWGNPDLEIPAWDQAGIVGVNNTHGTFWRYYDSNRYFNVSYSDPGVDSELTTGAIKPPSSPLYIYMFGASGTWRIEIGLTYVGGEVTLNLNKPQIFSVQMFKSSDVSQTNLLNKNVDAGSTYTFLVEYNYIKGGADCWDESSISLSAWYDEGNTLNGSTPDTSWATANNRTRQFYLNYSMTQSFSTYYPEPQNGTSEFFIQSVWEDPGIYNGTEYRHRIMINVTFGPQTWASTGAMSDAVNTWDKNMAFNDPYTWDLCVYLYNPMNATEAFNYSYEEFGVKEYASIYSTGNPGGNAAPGAVDFHLSNPYQIYYSINTAYVVNISVTDLHLNGDEGDLLNKIPASNLKIRNNHTLAQGNSEIYVMKAFDGANMALYVWNASGWSPINAPLHGTQSAGPGYTDYSVGFNPGVFEATKVEWWITVPVGLQEGVYWATITLTLGD